jgi:hypothetical protein
VQVNFSWFGFGQFSVCFISILFWGCFRCDVGTADAQAQADSLLAIACRLIVIQRNPAAADAPIKARRSKTQKSRKA